MATPVSLGMPASPPPVLAPRRPTRQLNVGGVGVGSDFPVSVQSMCTTKTADVNATLQQIAALTAGFPARRFGLASKGRLATGADADLALVALDERDEVRGDALLYRHRHSPYSGRTLRGRVMRTLVRGRTVYRDGRCVAAAQGRLVTPSTA